MRRTVILRNGVGSKTHRTGADNYDNHESLHGWIHPVKQNMHLTQENR